VESREKASIPIVYYESWCRITQTKYLVAGSANAGEIRPGATAILILLAIGSARLTYKSVDTRRALGRVATGEYGEALLSLLQETFRGNCVRSD